MVPVLLSKDSFKLFPINKDKILWFTPNEAFFDSLPVNIGDELRKEYNIVQMLNSPIITNDEKADLPTTCKYFEECKSNLFEVSNIELYPNPANETVTLSFVTDKSTNLTIMLYDILGRPVKQLKPSTYFPMGKQNFQLSLINVKSGIFLLNIRNTEGNYKTVRLIKR